MNQQNFRLYGLILGLLMVVGLLGFPAMYASAAETDTESASDSSWSLSSDGTLTITGSGEMMAPEWNTGLNALAIRHVVIEEGITTISKGAFTDCKNLQDVVMPSGITIIDEGAFKNCYSLKQISLPEGLLEIRYGAFYGCTELENIDLPSTLTKLGTSAFYECDSLVSVTIPANVSSYGVTLFAYCDSLEAVWLEGELPPTKAVDDTYRMYTTFGGIPVLYYPWTMESDNSWMTWQNLLGATVVLGYSSEYRGFVTSGSSTFFFDDNGIMLHGVNLLEDGLYYFSEKGRQCTGFVSFRNENDPWHWEQRYFDPLNNGALASGWTVINGVEFYLNERGVVQYGFVEIDGDYYYFTEKGQSTGFIKENGFIYYLDPDDGGKMHTGPLNYQGFVFYFSDYGYQVFGWSSRQSGGGFYYCLKEDTKIGNTWMPKGMLMTGWFEDNGNTFYLDPENNGMTAIGRKVIDGVTYFFDPQTGRLSYGVNGTGEEWYYFDESSANGLLGVTGWKQLENGKWIYGLGESGKLAYGWVESNGKWYYMDPYMKTGWVEDNGHWYYMDSNGAMKSGWIQYAGKWYYLKNDMKLYWEQVDGVWYYLGSDGAMKTGWQRISGTWYYLNANGSMATGWKQISGKWYYFGSDGAMKTGWQMVSGKWYYMDASGAMKTGWVKVSGTWYYLDGNGVMVTGSRVIDGTTYSFSATGAWIG